MANKFEAGKTYKEIGRRGTEYKVISRTGKTVTLEDVEHPGNPLHQKRKALKFYPGGGEYVEMEKGSQPGYRNHKKGVGRYLVTYGKEEVRINA